MDAVWPPHVVKALDTLRGEGLGTMAPVSAPSGDQYVIAADRQVVTIAEVGATLRSYEVDGSPVCWGFAEDEMCGGSRGQVLAPWPNRLRDGEYAFGGISAHAPLDEPERSNAIHGLVRWVPWRLVSHSVSSVCLDYRLYPQPGYPFQLLVEVEYSLGPSGLVVTTRATGEGAWSAPFGIGFHPYLSAGRDRADGARLALPARSRLILDDRALPIGSEPVDETAYSAVTGLGPVEQNAPIGPMRLDDCFSDVVVDDDGRWRAELLLGGAGAPVVLWADAVFKYIMCFSGDTLAEKDRRLAVAVEPMTCPPDAFRTGKDLIVLDPGATFEGTWGITPPTHVTGH